MKHLHAFTQRTATASWLRSFSCPGLGDGIEGNPSRDQQVAEGAYQRPHLEILGL